MGYNVVQAEEKDIEERNLRSDLTDVYICVFFDGTGNNMYEQANKSAKLKESNEGLPMTKVLVTSNPMLFPVRYAVKKCSEHEEQEEFGMTQYEEQRRQAEQEHYISEQRTKADDDDHNGGWKYSNIAVLRSITRKKQNAETTSPDGSQVIGDSYNIYIEGSGKKWKTGSDVVGLGMGTGRTGVVGLVSKAMVFIHNYLAFIGKDRRKEVKVHFAIFGFSRGATCGRVLSFLIASNKSQVNGLHRKSEFEQYLPKSIYANDTITFLEDFDKSNKVTVDFLGIYDTVSSIGFLLKDSDDTDAGINSTKKIKLDGGRVGYVNNLHSGFALSDAHNNFHCFNVREYGLYSPQLKNVKHTFHVCAMDEFRENFALVDIGRSISDTRTEVFMPGCHSDIGGGYTFEDEIDRYTLRRKIKGRVTTMIATADPRGGANTPPLTQNVLYSLGWFDNIAPDTTIKKYFVFNSTQTKKEWGIKGEQTLTTDAQTTYIDQMDDKIEFERHVMEGYSNIALEMMRKRACEDNGVGLKNLWPQCFLPFEDTLPKRFEQPNDIILDDIKNKCMAQFAEGQRHWIIPSMENYVLVRRRYLHWTCTDELNLEKGHIVASGANIGNAPNWKNIGSHFLLCRVVYHGDESDTAVHYMTDY